MWVVMSSMSPEEAMAAADKVKKWADINSDKQLAEELVLLTVRRLSFNDTIEVATKFTALIAAARKARNSRFEAEVLHSYAYYLASQRRYALAFEHYLEAYNIYRQYKSDNFPNKQEYLFELGGAYHHFGDFESAVKYLKEALQTRAWNRESLAKPLYNNIGLAYRNLNRYDSSEKYLRILYEQSVKDNDTVWIGIAGGNIGINYYLQNRYDEAIPLLEKDIEISLKHNNLRNAAKSMTILANIFFSRQKYDNAQELLKHALAISEGRRFWPDYQLAEGAYTLLFKIYMAKNDRNNAAIYADSAIIAKDSVTSQANTLNFAKTKEKFVMEEHKLEVEQLNSQKKIDVLVRNGLILFIAMFTAITIMFVNRQRLKQKKLEAEKKNAETELDVAAMQLENFRQSVQEKNNIIERFTSELENIKRSDNQETETELLTKMESAIILTDEQWENFRQMFEKVHKGFFVKLKKKIPDLTQAEIRFLALTKLKLTSKEMAAMLGISLNAIRIYKYRLRKKLDLDKEDMIEELVENI